MEETEYMMDLCKRFDCRFILVHDRYDDKLHGKDRSVEEIKDRYYKITAPMNQSKNDTKVFLDYKRGCSLQPKIYPNAPNSGNSANICTLIYVLRFHIYLTLPMRKKERNSLTCTSGPIDKLLYLGWIPSHYFENCYKVGCVFPILSKFRIG